MSWTTVILLCALVAGSFAIPRHLGKRNLIKKSDRYDPLHNECGITADDRQYCGKPTYDEEECDKRSCCFEPCPNCGEDVPWCFLAKRMLRPECNVGYEQKDDCGYYGIKEGECFMRGCCWKPSGKPNDPPCFHGVSIRLVNGDENTDTTISGRVEIKHEGQWGTICDDNFDNNAAKVVCKTLGYDNSQPKGYAQYGEGSGQIWLDGMRCTGDEDRIEDCDHNGWGSHDCGHSEDSGVVCSHEETEGDYNYVTDYPIDPYYYNYNYNYYGSDEDEDEDEDEDDSYDIDNYGDGDYVDDSDSSESEEEYPWYRLGGKGGKGGKGGRSGFKGKPHMKLMKRSKLRSKAVQNKQH